MATDTWRAFREFDRAPDGDGGRSAPRIINVTWRRPKAEGGPCRPAGSALMSAATVLLGLLAVGLFVVSLSAQYQFVLAQKHTTVPAVIEAAGLDVGMVIFSLLALGLARAGQPAKTERGLIIACAAGSAAMNFAAANTGSPRSVAAFVLPPVFLAVVIDRVVAVIRRHVLGDTESSAWTGFGRVALYGLRFVLAAPSTASGLRRQVLVLTPLPDAARAAVTSSNVAALAAAPTPASAAIPTDPEPEAAASGTRPEPAGRPRGGSKTARFLALVEDRHGELAAIDPVKVGRIASDLAPEVGLDVGAARSALRPRVLAAQAGGAR